MSRLHDRPNMDVTVAFENNLIIDFMGLAEEKYGFDAVHPNLRPVVDAGDVEEDGDKDENDESDDDDAEGKPEEGTDAGAEPGAEAGVAGSADKPKKRQYQSRYDLNDPFIDDDEMQWEEQAAATKDGFFVYAGPLVPEAPLPEAGKSKDEKKRPYKRRAKNEENAPARKKKLVSIEPAKGATGVPVANGEPVKERRRPGPKPKPKIKGEPKRRGRPPKDPSDVRKPRPTVKASTPSSTGTAAETSVSATATALTAQQPSSGAPAQTAVDRTGDGNDPKVRKLQKIAAQGDSTAAKPKVTKRPMVGSVKDKPSKVLGAKSTIAKSGTKPVTTKPASAKPVKPASAKLGTTKPAKLSTGAGVSPDLTQPGRAAAFSAGAAKEAPPTPNRIAAPPAAKNTNGAAGNAHSVTPATTYIATSTPGDDTRPPTA